MVLRRLAQLLCLASTLAAGAIQPARPAFAQIPSGNASTLSLGLARMSEQVPQKVATGNGAFSVWVTLEGTHVELDLKPYSLRRPYSEAFEEGPGGVRKKVELPPSKTYRGTVQGDVKGVVAATIEGDAVQARILLDDGSDWYVQPIPERGAGAHAVYRGTDITEPGGSCGSEEVPGVERLPNLAPQAQSSGCVEADIAIEADYQYYQWNGSSSPQTINDIDAVMNAVELIYARDVKISYRVTHYLIQTSSGKYSSSDAGTKLVQFRDWWNANQGSVTRDVATLFAGTPMNGGLIGTAYFSVLCNTSNAYGIACPSWSTLWANRVGVVAHELGHNWGAMHCSSSDTDCWIMCPNIGGCAVDPTRFSPGSIREIETYRNVAGSCLAAGTGTPTALNPTARDDRSVALRGTAATISVLANDFDPNCQTISVASYPASTSNGGTVTASGDNLVYTPSVNFIGEDSFQYTVRDAGGAQATATVTVSVQDYKSAETVTGAVAGLQVRYYYVPPLDGSLGSMPTLSNPFRVETVQTLSLASTTGVIGSSGLKDKVALRATGKINLPTTDTYTFYLTSDDGAKLYIDGTLRVDNDGIHTILERSASVSLSAGVHDVRVDYYDATGPAVLRLELRSSTLARSEIPATMWTTGVQVAYYQLDSSILPPLKALVPEKTQLVTTVDVPFSWGTFSTSGRSLHVGAVYEGYLTVPSDGVYFFDLTSEDGSKLYIGDQLIINNDGVHNRVTQSGGIPLRTGAHKTRIEYFLREGGSMLTISVWSAALTKRVVPASWWSHLTTYHVPTDYATISAAISAATANSMVWVAAGTYVGTANKNLDLGNKSVSLVGGGGPELTILDAENSGRAFRFVNHSQQAAVIEGFTISRAANTAGGIGGAMLFDNSTLRVKNCVIAGNSNPGNGGAIGTAGNANPTFENCVVSGNRAGGAGGGIYADAGSRPSITGSTVSGNYAVTWGGGVCAAVGGAPTFDRTIVWGNGAAGYGNDAWTVDAASTLNFTCSDVRSAGIGGAGSEIFGANTIYNDPRFCSPVSPSLAPTTGGGYGVAASSPVLSSACGGIIGARGQSCNSAITAVESSVPGVSAATLLEQNVPNPFNPSTRIAFTLLRDARATLRVFDAGGRLVVTLLDQDLPAGRHTVAWDGLDGRRQRVATGVYFYQLRNGAEIQTRNMVLLK